MEKSRAVILVGLAALAGSWFASAEEFHPVTHRRIAQVMGAAGADWLVRPERESDEHPDQALDAIGIQRGATVADIGAGVGYFTWRLADRVGANGIVYGEDIQQQMLDMLTKNMSVRHLSNVHAVLGTIDDPKLPKSSLDLVLLVDVYHEFSEPEKMLDRIRDALKPNGRIVFLEYRAEDPKVPIREEHKMTVAQVRAEVQPEGYKFDKAIEVLPQQHIIVFRKQ
ncbi:MAG TPA: methyltransferase domain-containing protein [Bryobacteraceae bacterium]|jgi:ubiquinone/menaquinone biosynthesis C-methylase UbiE|nr:methyltransferase domain-containing protein [Bryobacteraceae bacterium]